MTLPLELCRRKADFFFRIVHICTECDEADPVEFAYEPADRRLVKIKQKKNATLSCDVPAFGKNWQLPLKSRSSPRRPLGRSGCLRYRRGTGVQMRI
jgi:hypothetical protein